MPIKKLPHEVQNLLRAASQINTFKRAVEELVFNSLDAGAASIAIRVNIPEGTIQVIDNGCGVRHSDMMYIGQRHMTSNYVNMLNLKTVPYRYGLRGEALANIITVSQAVNIVTRLADKEDTWIKSYYNGREQKIAIACTRPSKGTTIEIKGFLYNLNIQKKRMNNIDELQNIRTFLEELSLVHSNISISLRDDTRNEIIFQIHKKRDIYQTLYSLFNINRSNVQELSVEKNEYKVIGFIGKNDDIGKHWMYLNGRIISPSNKLYKMVNDNFYKYMHDLNKLKTKTKIVHGDNENNLNNNNIPFYFIFISCPYLDYDVSYTPNHSLIEFNDWNKIKLLLEKLIKFYVGDINLKSIKNPENVINDNKESNIREEVKKIMDKMLEYRSGKPCISKMQNGIKGKLIKRKNKKKPKLLSKINHSLLEHKSPEEINIALSIHTPDIQINKRKYTIPPNINKKINKCKLSRNAAANKNEIVLKRLNQVAIINDLNKQRNLNKEKRKTHNKCKNINVTTQKGYHKRLTESKLYINDKITNYKNSGGLFTKDSLIKKFEVPTDSLKQRCALIAKDAEKILNKIHQNRRQIIRNGTIAYNSITKSNRNITIRKTIDEIIVHDYYPRTLDESVDYRVWKKPKACPYITTYDLVQTVLDGQDKLNFQETNKNEDLNILNESLYSPTYLTTSSIKYGSQVFEDNRFKRTLFNEILKSNSSPMGAGRCANVSSPPLMYNSHCYQKYDSNLEDNAGHNNNNKQNRKSRFITKNSKDNFIFHENYSKNFKKSRSAGRSNILDKKTMLSKQRHAKHNIAMSSYTIEFSENRDDSNNRLDLTTNNVNDNLANSVYSHLRDSLTYTIPCKPKFPMPINTTYGVEENTYGASHLNDVLKAKKNYEQELINHNYELSIKSKFFYPSSLNFNNNTIEFKQRNRNVVFISNSQHTNYEENDLSTNSNSNNKIYPIQVCETVLNDDTFNKSFNLGQQNMCLSNNEMDQMNYHSKEKIAKEILTINNEELSNDVNCTNKVVIEKMDSNNSSRLVHNVEPKQGCVVEHHHMEHSFFEANNIFGFRDHNPDSFDFNIKNRLRFLPKGMSQIFENCNTKTACDYNLDKDYFDNNIYDNFVNDVQINSEIYEPRINHLNDIGMRNYEKSNIKLVHDNASLKFNAHDLKDAKVLGQVDSKFIAAVIDGYCTRADKMSNFLVLFDQHAVHERIRLENNLIDYIFDNKWVSVSIEEFILALSKDEILYLHNYKEKFEVFGLKWTILENNEVKIYCIPQAILGKHPRQIDKVIKAIKNLIAEEIDIIKIQKGCISLYPKSIMDLVFSEACRYAVKFGDHLSRADCEEMIKNLSDCKTPFQCAHGRPAMAVLLNYTSSQVLSYKINPEKLGKLSHMIRK